MLYLIQIYKIIILHVKCKVYISATASAATSAAVPAAIAFASMPHFALHPTCFAVMKRTLLFLNDY